MNDTDNGFIVLFRTEETEALLRDYPKAYLLLTQICLRARWREEADQVTGLEQFQSRIGDYLNAGLSTQQEYRVAKRVLEKLKFVTFKGTNRGTVATLVNQRIFGVVAPTGTSRGTNKERSRNEQGTTKNKENKENKETTPPVEVDREAWMGWAKEERILLPFARELYSQCKANRWADRNGERIRSPRGYLRRCAKAKAAFEPIRAADPKPDEPKPAAELVDQDEAIVQLRAFRNGSRNVA